MESFSFHLLSIVTYSDAMGFTGIRKGLPRNPESCKGHQGTLEFLNFMFRYVQFICYNRCLGTAQTLCVIARYCLLRPGPPTADSVLRSLCNAGEWESSVRSDPPEELVKEYRIMTVHDEA